MSLRSAEHPIKAKNGAASFKLSIIFLLWNIVFVVPACGFSLKSCRISEGTAICRDGHLKAVPLDIPSTVVGIDLTINRISSIQATDFTDLPELIKLDLSRNYITKINDGAFAHLSSLKILNLNSNKLGTLEEDVFAGLGQLTELRITSNSITNVKYTAFRSTTSLKLLDLSHNKLRRVDTVLRYLPHLQELYVDTNLLTAFRSWEVSNSSLGLRYLGLSQNPLRIFNITTNVFPNLTWLSLASSSRRAQMKFEVRDRTFLTCVSSLDISGLSMALDDVRTFLESVNSSLTSLRMNGMRLDLGELIDISCSIPTLSKLQLQKNNLGSIGWNLFRLCVNVVELNLRDSNVRNISNDAFKSLRSLRILNLSRNNLFSVPAATRNLPRLQELDLSTCKLNALQCDDFANQTNLRQLNLYQNSIEHLNNCLFADLQQLRILKLQTNKICTLNYTFKKTLPKLQRLQLNGNKIVSINNEEFGGLTSLQDLFLDNNTIKTLSKNSFIGLTNLTSLKLQVNKISAKQLQTGAFNALISLRSLDLTENEIQYKEKLPLSSPPFFKMSSLEELSIRGQGDRGWSYLPQNFLQGLTNLLSFSCRNMRLKSLHEDTFTFTPRLEHLDINSNTLSPLSSRLFSPVGNLKILYLSKNYLESLDFFLHANLTKLEFLQARMNQYSVFRAEVINSLPALVYVDLQGNSFTCDCDNEWFIQWVQKNTQTQVFDAYNFECNYPPSLKGKPLLGFDVQSCSLDTSFICFVATTCATLCLMVVPSVYHFMRWQLVYAYYIFLAWLADTKHKNRNAPHQYDAFISYNVHDEPWVIEELLPKLEGEQGWRLCLHHRDFEPGKPVIDNITEAIYGSRKTLCVISRGYLESEWCSREIQAASFRLFDEKKDVLILVFLEEIPASKLSPYHRMRKLLKKQTYLSWTRAGEHAGLFWEKLRQALQAGQEPDEERFHLTLVDT